MFGSSKRHLHEADEGYFEHLKVAGSFSLKLAKASLACGIHALVPGLFTRTASGSVAGLQAQLAARSALARRRADGVGNAS
jgi:hypothetical protein